MLGRSRAQQASTLEHWENVLEQALIVERTPFAGEEVGALKEKAHLSSPPSRNLNYSTLDTPRAATAAPVQSVPITAVVQKTSDGRIYAHPVSFKMGTRDSGISDAWQEVAHAAEEQKEQLTAELTALKATHAGTLSELSKVQRKLEASEASAAAWWEASLNAQDAQASEVKAALDQAEARAGKKTALLSSKADMALRDLATLKAQNILSGVHHVTLNRELALLDGTVGFLMGRLATIQGELDAALNAQQAHREAAEASQARSSVVELKVQHLERVNHAQKRTVDELKEHVAGAQVWAREAEASFLETLTAIRYAAAEQLRIQDRRLRAWEGTLEHAHPEQQQQRANDGLVAELIGKERAIIDKQAKLFSDAIELSGKREAKLLRERVVVMTEDLEEMQRLDRDFQAELSAVGRANHAQALSNVRGELDAARNRLREQDETIKRLEDWMGAEVAAHKMGFDKAVQQLIDKAARLTTEEAAALTQAAEADSVLQEEVQAADGSKSFSAPSLAESGTRHRSSTAQRDAPILRKMASYGKGGGGGAGGEAGGGDGGKGDGGGGDGSACKELSPSSSAAPSPEDVATRQEVSRLCSRLAAVEEELRYRVEEAAASLMRESDEHRRESADARRWAAQLEAKLEQAAAALDLERDESLRLEAEVQSLRERLTEAEQHLAGAGPSSPGAHPGSRSVTFEMAATSLGAQVGSGKQLKHASKRLQRARARVATPVLEPAGGAENDSAATQQTGATGRPPLVVGTPSDPRDTALRPPATLAKTSPNVSFARGEPMYPAPAATPLATPSQRPGRGTTSSPGKKSRSKARVV